MNKKLSKDEILIASKDLIDELLDDQYRPKYHFAVPGDFGLPGDPNGAFYAKGKYHLMYLYKNRKDGFRWGHMSSHDLLHWRFHKDALVPSDNDGGVFSGGAFVDDDGKAYLTFWQLPKNYKSGMRESEGLGISIAVSDDHNFEKWTKYGYPIIPSTRFGVLEQFNDDAKLTDVIACADPSNIWKKDGKYYLLTGTISY